MKLWWKPDDTHSSVVTEADGRVGGRFHVRMISPEGREHDVSGVYLEVVPNRKLVFTWVGKETSERETLVTVILRPSGSGTELELDTSSSLTEKIAIRIKQDGAAALRYSNIFSLAERRMAETTAYGLWRILTKREGTRSVSVNRRVHSPKPG